MTFKQLLNTAPNKQKAQRLIYFLSSKVKNLNEYLLFKDDSIDFCIQEFNQHIANNTPIERLEKKVFFYENEFILLDKVFCPRHETELLVQELIKRIGKHSTYIDICCGTGVIGISVMLRNPHVHTSLLDISEFAIDNTKKNLLKHNLRANTILGDWLEHLKNHSYEVISANFPYIGYDDPIDQEILKYDPKLSLFAEEEGWIHYKNILNHLNNNAHWKLVILECNSLHENRWKKIQKETDKLNFEFIYDLNNLFRIIIITKPKTN